MHDNLINTAAKSPANKVSPYITQGNSNHNILGRILLIKNSTVSRENNSHITSLLWSANNFLSKIKEQFSRKILSQPAVDIELNNIISQGRELSQDSDTLYHLLNDKKDIAPSSILSPTTKIGMVLLTEIGRAHV